MRGELGAQVRRNFAETFPIFAGGVAALWAAGGFGEYSATGVSLYAAGRVLYLVLSVRPLRRVRKFSWALSVAGLIGLGVQLVLAVGGG